MLNVLLVADNPSAVLTWRRALEDKGYRVFTAADSQSALQTVIHETIDLIAAPALTQEAMYSDMREVVWYAAAEMLSPGVPVLMGAALAGAAAAQDQADEARAADMRNLMVSVQALLSAAQPGAGRI